MAGTDTVRGIAYQQAHAVLVALDLLGDHRTAALRVEGVADVIDVELLDEAGDIIVGKQIKTRASPYTWGRADLVSVLRRWGELTLRPEATFEFLTDGRLGPTGEEVQTALRNAADGDRSGIAALLAEDPDSPASRAAARATIRIDATGTASLLSRAERQLAGLLPPARTRQDNLDLARQGVDTLFRLLIDRASQPDPAARLVHRAELSEAAGVPLELPTLRWEADYVDRLLAARRAKHLDELVSLDVIPIDPVRASAADDGSSPSEHFSVVLGHRVALVVGRTGAGKSTAAQMLSQAGAGEHRPVLVAQAEAYLANQLNALAADAIGATLDEEVSSAVGREALADESATLLIDGVSEVPKSLRDALAEDLRSWAETRRGCRLILMGRDIADLRSALPTTASPALFRLAPLSREAQLDLTQRTFTSASAQAAVELEDVRRVLGDGTGNPLLLSMALAVSAEGVAFESRGSLYDEFLALLAARSGTRQIEFIAAVLGVVFAGLLDEGRRFADAFDWRRRLLQAHEAVGSALGVVSADEGDHGSRKAGLVVPIDFAETMVPMHDSFADYLAGKAHARGLVVLPERLKSADEQRLLFAAEYAGVDSQTARRVVTDLPFAAVRLAPYDGRQLGESDLEEVEQLLRELLPSGAASTGVAAWEVGDGRIVVMSHQRTKWLDRDEAGELMAQGRSVILTGASPLASAVELWRDWLKASLVARSSAGAPRPLSQAAAVATLQAHAQDVAGMLRELVPRIAPAGGAAMLDAELGPLGMDAVVHPVQENHWGRDWPVSYAGADHVDVRSTATDPGGLPADGEFRAHSSVEYLTRESAASTAVKLLRAALDRLSRPQWLS